MRIEQVGALINSVAASPAARAPRNGAFAALLADVTMDGHSRADFTHITPRQMGEAAIELVAAGRASQAGLAAVVELAETSDAPDEPINMIAYLRNEASANERTAGGMAAAFRQRAALAVLVRVQREEGGAVVYDRNFPHAPRDLTAEEANAKLKTAIAAFRNEASLTPTQRLAKKLRADVMQSMKVTEASLEAMPPDQREALNKKIDDEVARRLVALGFAAGTANGKATKDTLGDAAPLGAAG